MGRKNNRSGRRPQARRRPDGLAPRRGTPPPPIDRVVIPAGRCFHKNRKGKLIFVTEEKAYEALRQAKAAKIRQGSGHVPQRVYPCPEGGCGGFHLSSRTQWVDRGKA